MITRNFRYLSSPCLQRALSACFSFVYFLSSFQTLHAQTSAEDELSDDDMKQILDDAPWVSPRALGMSGALSTLADGYDAPYYNPAGIGGLSWGQPKKPVMRNMYFPLSGLSLNQNSYRLHNEFSKKGGASDSTVGGALVDAAQGKRQYARVSNMLGLGIKRSIFLPYLDQQGAAVSQGEEGRISGRFNFTSGYGSGFSVSNPQGTFLLGTFGFVESRTTYKGNFNYQELIDKEARSEALKNNRYTYSGQGMHIGTIVRMPKKLQPSFAINLRHVGNTKYKLKKAPAEDTEAATEIKKQDLTVGFSISPEFKNVGGYWNWIVEGADLLDKDTDMGRKFRIANEFSLGGFGNDSIFALRAGYSDAGPSGGLSLNLGLINLEASVASERYGIDNNSQRELRGSAVIYIDVSE